MYRKVIYAFTRNCCNQALALTTPVSGDKAIYRQQYFRYGRGSLRALFRVQRVSETHKILWLNADDSTARTINVRNLLDSHPNRADSTTDSEECRRSPDE